MSVRLKWLTPAQHRGGQPSGPGIYLNLHEWEFTKHFGGTLPGAGADRYLKVPGPMVLVLGPVMGGFYVLLVPVVGVATALYVLGRWAGRAVQAMGRDAIVLIPFPNWVPGRAYLTGLQSKRKKDAKQDTGQLDAELKKLAEEIEKKRKKERTG